MSMNVTFEDGIYTFKCPHCKNMVMVLKNETACCIFRHGQFKDSNRQIPPHSRKEDCDKWAKEGKIYGCGKPFKFIHGNPPYVEVCGYI